MKERSFIRQQRRLNADFNREHGWTKAILVEAVRNVQHVCPPRPSQQSKADLERIVRGALMAMTALSESVDRLQARCDDLENWEGADDAGGLARWTGRAALLEAVGS